MSAAAAMAAILAALPLPAPPPAPVHAEAKEWAVEASPHGAGAAAIELHLTARAGYHVNLDYPAAFVPSAEGTVRFESARVPLKPSSTAPCQGKAGEVCSASFVLPYSPPAAGPVRVAGTFAFSVCTAERCLIEKVPVSVSAVPAPGRG